MKYNNLFTVAMEAPEDEPQSTDYTEEDDTANEPTDYNEDDNTEEDEEVTADPDNEEQDTDAESEDYGADDPDATGDEPPTQDEGQEETPEEEPANPEEEQHKDSKKKLYLSMMYLYERIGDILLINDRANIQDIYTDQVLRKTNNNLTELRKVLWTYLAEDFISDSYVENLKVYQKCMLAAKLSIKMLEQVKTIKIDDKKPQ